MKKLLKNIDLILKFFGIYLRRYPQKDLRSRMQLLKHHNIEMIFDVGANTGQYAKLMRSLGYNGEIISFEPLKDCCQKLLQASKKDNKWNFFNIALGNETGTKTILRAKNTRRSSFLKFTELNSIFDNRSLETTQEIVSIDKIDNYSSLIHGNVLLKIDTEGFEREVLLGSENVLSKFSGVQIECFLNPLYVGSMTITDIIHFLSKYGFKLKLIENESYHPKTGELIGCDLTFYKN